MDPLWEQINTAIHQRDLNSVYSLIPKFLKKHSGAVTSKQAIYEASEFYRKISDYSSALKVLPQEHVHFKKGSFFSDMDTKLELQSARILNILGASSYALRMIDRIRKEGRSRSKVEMLEVYFCARRYDEMLEVLGPDFSSPDFEPWHQDWLLDFYYSLAMSGVKKWELAIERVKKIRVLSKSPLIQSIACCYHGQFLLESGKAKEALPLLLRSLQFFRKNDPTADNANLQWSLGKCYLSLHKYQKAKEALEHAFQICYQPGIKPEDWMELLVCLESLPGHASPQKGFAQRMLAMGGPNYLPLKSSAAVISSQENSIFSIAKIEVRTKKRHYDRESDIVWTGKTAHLGIDLVDELVYNLIYAGKYGLPQFKVFELLWPEELFSFDQHQKRLEQVIMRARKRGYRIKWKQLHLYLLSKDVSTSGNPKKTVRGYSFLREHPIFSRKDVQRYFSISKPSAALLCRDWFKAKLISPLKNAKYKVGV